MVENMIIPHRIIIMSLFIAVKETVCRLQCQSNLRLINVVPGNVYESQTNGNVFCRLMNNCIAYVNDLSVVGGSDLIFKLIMSSVGRVKDRRQTSY